MSDRGKQTRESGSGSKSGSLKRTQPRSPDTRNGNNSNKSGPREKASSKRKSSSNFFVKAARRLMIAWPKSVPPFLSGFKEEKRQPETPKPTPVPAQQDSDENIPKARTPEKYETESETTTGTTTAPTQPLDYSPRRARSIAARIKQAKAAAARASSAKPSPTPTPTKKKKPRKSKSSSSGQKKTKATTKTTTVVTKDEPPAKKPPTKKVARAPDVRRKMTDKEPPPSSSKPYKGDDSNKVSPPSDNEANQAKSRGLLPKSRSSIDETTNTVIEEAMNRDMIQKLINELTPEMRELDKTPHDPWVDLKILRERDKTIYSREQTRLNTAATYAFFADNELCSAKLETPGKERVKIVGPINRRTFSVVNMDCQVDDVISLRDIRMLPTQVSTAESTPPDLPQAAPPQTQKSIVSTYLVPKN